MTAILAQSQKQYFGLRTMNPLNDLGGVANLIEEAFANELDRSGKNALKELRWLSRLKPVLWWMMYSNPDHSDFLSGFVWEEDGKIVGNITVNRSASNTRRWLISNVAVSKDYRGRGIGRTLMDAAIELVNEYHGSVVSLQVRSNNEQAKHLYRSLGFKDISGTAYLKAGHVPRTEGLHALPKLPQELNMRARKYNYQDNLDAYTLGTASTPAAVQKEWPLHRHDFQLSSQQRINNFFCKLIGAGISEHWVIEDGQRFVALIDIQPGVLQQTHRLRLIVHPDWRGHLEKLLIGQALNYLYTWHNKNIIVRHASNHTEAVEVFKVFGFQEQQNLIWMKLEM